MKKSDNFFDISGTAPPDSSEPSAEGSVSAVDFDVFGSAAPAAVAEDSDHAQTALLPEFSPPVRELTFAEDDALPAPANPAVAPPKAASISFPEPAPSPPAGGNMRWFVLALVVLLGVAAWWLLR